MGENSEKEEISNIFKESPRGWHHHVGLSAWPHHQPRSAAGGEQQRGLAFAVLITAGSHAGPDEAFKGQ